MGKNCVNQRGRHLWLKETAKWFEIAGYIRVNTILQRMCQSKLQVFDCGIMKGSPSQHAYGCNWWRQLSFVIKTFIFAERINKKIRSTYLPLGIRSMYQREVWYFVGSSKNKRHALSGVKYHYDNNFALNIYSNFKMFYHKIQQIYFFVFYVGNQKTIFSRNKKQ